MMYKGKIKTSEMKRLWGSRIAIWIAIAASLFPEVWIVM